MGAQYSFSSISLGATHSYAIITYHAADPNWKSFKMMIYLIFQEKSNGYVRESILVNISF